MVILFACLGVFVLGLIVFGGGQVFMPLFKTFWQLIDPSLDDNVVNNVFAVANSTPGVVSTKFGLFTGYLISHGEWWGYLAMFLTYLVFAAPSIFMIVVTTKMIRKSKDNKYLKNMLIFLRPIIIGVLVSLSTQLLIGTMFPNIFFNSTSETKSMAGIVPITDKRAAFFSGWRFWLLIAWMPSAISFSLFWMKKKWPLLALILLFIAICMTIFVPWNLAI